MKTGNIFFIVDDDADDLELFIQALLGIDKACHCITALNGREALHKIENEMLLIPDFIFSDLNMPLMNGHEFLTEIKKNEQLRDVPIIIYSTSYQKNDIDNKENVRIFLNTLLDSTLTTMKVLLELDGIKKEVAILSDAKKIPHIEAGAIAGIVSAHFTVSLVLGFTMDVFKKAMSRFLQAEITEITPEIKTEPLNF